MDVFETPDLDLVWKKLDGKQYSIWRPREKSGFHTVTHHITEGHAEPGIGFLVKPKDSTLVAMPESYSLHMKIEDKGGRYVYENEKTYAYVYLPNCPPGTDSNLHLRIYMTSYPYSGAKHSLTASISYASTPVSQIRDFEIRRVCKESALNQF